MFCLVLSVSFISCNNNDTTPEGYGDVYVVSKIKTTGETSNVAYGLFIQASGLYGTLSSVTVTNGTKSYTLQEDSNTGFFYYESDYSTSLPTKGTYTFNYLFSSGEINTSSNVLTENVLEPANITNCAFSNNEINLKWDAVEDADAIYVQLKKADGTLIFSSVTNSYLLGTATSYDISTSTGTWASDYDMVNGTTYTVEVIALMADQSNSVQAMSIASQTVVWGSAE